MLLPDNVSIFAGEKTSHFRSVGSSFFRLTPTCRRIIATKGSEKGVIPPRSASNPGFRRQGSSEAWWHLRHLRSESLRGLTIFFQRFLSICIYIYIEIRKECLKIGWKFQQQVKTAVSGFVDRGLGFPKLYLPKVVRL